jgi:xylan 1,4-beta-xylosidase
MGEIIVIDAAGSTTPFPHFWEHMFGSCHASVTLCEDWRNDLRMVREIVDVKYVRFHGIFERSVGIYDHEDKNGNPILNFTRVDLIYDGLLRNGVRPFVEIGFMPEQLAKTQAVHPFWYHPIVAPPRDPQKWYQLIFLFAQHLVDRYGLAEVSGWYFEVWNEPNIDFWAGEPKQITYWELYDHTARAIKAVNPRLRIGGPATAQAAWVDAFIQHCAQNNVPLDFVSTHVYGNDRAQDVFGTDEDIPRDKMVCRAVGKVHDQIKNSSQPNLPLIWSEYNASYKNEPEVTDSIYMGPWLADTIRQCDGLVDVMSYWTFSDVFEEQGVVKTPFYGGYGLIAEDDIPKPAYEVFELLHRLGAQRIALDSDSALLTRTSDGRLVLALWNYAPPDRTGSPLTFALRFKNTKVKVAFISRVDRDHGDVRPVYEKMGSPRYPTQTQINQLRTAARLPAPETRELKNGELTLTVPAHGLAVIELK